MTLEGSEDHAWEVYYPLDVEAIIEAKKLYISRLHLASQSRVLQPILFFAKESD